MIVWDHWHIEPSSICTLKCPRCPRAEVPDTLLNRQLSLDFFKNQIGADTVRKIRKITFCGNDGDPIYCRDLADICVWLKTLNPELQITIITNGSYRSSDWWQYLGRILGPHDEVHWSLDGWDQSSNEQYRVNSDWSSITAGIDAFRSVNTETYRVWAAIGFKFNQGSINDMKSAAKALGFDCFQLTKSTKFGSHYPDVYGVDDPLMPDHTELVATGSRFEREVTVFTDRSRPGKELKELFFTRAQDLQQQNQYSGICLIGNKGVFLNSLGEFYPCCWTANRYEHNRQWTDLAKSRFNLHERSFQDIIADEFWTTDFLKFDSVECQTKCTKEKLNNIQHTTEW